MCDSTVVYTEEIIEINSFRFWGIITLYVSHCAQFINLNTMNDELIEHVFGNTIQHCIK